MKLLGFLLAAMALFTPAQAADEDWAGSLRTHLSAAAAALQDSPANDERAAPWRNAAVRCELLMRAGRLLSEDISEKGKSDLASALRAADSAETNVLRDLVATFPTADELVFDGRKYGGSNLSYIDTILGMAGRPIALDRELPAFLVALTAAGEATLIAKRTAFSARTEHRDLQIRADEAYGESSASWLFADGQFLRPYCGRFDDLYFHLFQNGNGASALAFGALAHGLGERVYQTVNGIRRQETVPAAAFDLDDILSGGGKGAVNRHLREQSGRADKPFQGFAFRVLPSLIAKARALPAGARFTASHAEILRALRVRQHFFPTQVPPLYRSPDRFLGWSGSSLMRVANGPALPAGVADTWFPLPEREGRAGKDERIAEAANSATLFESSSASPLVWDDPQLSQLLATPETQPAPAKSPRAGSSAPDSAKSPADVKPPRRAPAGRLIAIVTPTAEEARDYRAAIAASDEKLRAIEQVRGRIRLLRGFVESARTVKAEALAATDLDRRIENFERVVVGDLASFDQVENKMAEQLQEALQERADIRSDLETRLRRERVEPLQALGKAPEAPPGEDAKPLL